MGAGLNWHRLFGLMLTDYFEGSGYTVELEMDLSAKRQMLDVVVVRAAEGARLERASDGFEALAKHNLLTYKSLRESLTEWSLDELVGHYVNYRKKLGVRIVAPGDVRLFAVTTRHPEGLGRRFELENVKPGVYNLKYGAHVIRIIVLPGVREETRNALWELFSAEPMRMRHGIDEYKFHMQDLSTAIDELFEQYELEGLNMPYTVEQYYKYYVLKHLHKIPPKEILQHLKPADRLAGLKPADRLAGLKPEQVEKWLKAQKKVKRTCRKR